MLWGYPGMVVARKSRCRYAHFRMGFVTMIRLACPSIPVHWEEALWLTEVARVHLCDNFDPLTLHHQS